MCMSHIQLLLLFSVWIFSLMFYVFQPHILKVTLHNSSEDECEVKLALMLRRNDCLTCSLFLLLTCHSNLLLKALQHIFLRRFYLFSALIVSWCVVECLMLLLKWMENRKSWQWQWWRFSYGHFHSQESSWVNNEDFSLEFLIYLFNILWFVSFFILYKNLISIDWQQQKLISKNPLMHLKIASFRCK